VPQGVLETQNGKPLRYTWPTQTLYQPAHYHTYHSPVYVQVPQFMYGLNTYTICTQYVVQCSEQDPPEFGITLVGWRNTETGGKIRLSHATLRHICMAQDGKSLPKS
jgi:hypothetical protein